MNQALVATPIDTDFAGKSAQAAHSSVMRVLNQKAGMAGTGFLHSSGRAITAEHVVRGAGQGDIILLTAQGTQIQSKSVLANATLDLAMIEPVAPLSALTPLPIATAPTLKVGTMLATWGTRPQALRHQVRLIQ